MTNLIDSIMVLVVVVVLFCGFGVLASIPSQSEIAKIIIEVGGVSSPVALKVRR